MSFTILSLITAFVIRFASWFVALKFTGFWKLDAKELLTVVTLSTFLGVVVPAMGLFDITGIIFRVILLSLLLTVMLKMDLTDSMFAVLIAAVITTVITTVLSLTPLGFLVAGLAWPSIP